MKMKSLIRVCSFVLALLTGCMPLANAASKVENYIAEGNIAALIEEGAMLSVKDVTYSENRFDKWDRVVLVPLGNGELLVSSRNDVFPEFLPYLCPEKAGLTRELTVDENDADAWIKMMARIKQDMDADMRSYAEKQGINLDPATAEEAYCSIFSIYPLIGTYQAGENRLLIQQKRGGYYVIETDTAVIRPFLNARGLTRDGKVIVWENSANWEYSYALVDQDMNYEAVNLHLPDEWYATDLYPMCGGMVLLLQQRSISRDGTEYAVGWADVQGEVTEIVSLGTFKNMMGPDRLVCLPEARAVIAWAPMYPMYLHAMILREGAAEPAVLRINGAALEEIPLSEFTAAGGDITDVKNPLYILGAGKDGRTLMMADYRTPTLVAADMLTMQTATLLADGAAFEAAGLNSIKVTSLSWDGGEYMYSYMNIVRLIPAAKNPIGKKIGANRP